MANLNLSQFGENTSVSDADYTFVWDTVGAISKRVSRNSWLNSGTLTSDAPVTISQTWAGTGSTVFKALVVNAVATGATSSALSSLLDLQTSGASQLSFGQGFITFSNTSANVPASGFCMGVAGGQYMLLRAGNSSNQFTFSGTGLSLDNENHAIFFGGGVATAPRLYKDANYTLALRNGANAQTFNVYGTYTSGTSYERLTLSAPSAANAIIGTNKGSGGGTARGLDLHTDGAARMTISTAGNVGIGTTAPTKLLEVALPATGNTLGQGVRLSRGTGYFSLENGSSGAGFLGSFVGKGTVTAAAYALIFEGISGSDADNSNPVLLFTAKNNSGSAVIGNSQTAFQFENYITPLLTIKGSGNVGIGTTSPTSKLQVTGGDVEIETVTSGIIMKAAGTATRYRITLNAGGTDLVFTAI